MITEDKVESALEYLRDSAKQYGEICGLVELKSHQIKIYRSMKFLESTGTVAEREAIAWCSQQVKDAVHDHAEAVAEKNTIYTTRKAAELTCEIWRSQNASSRARVM